MKLTLIFISTWIGLTVGDILYYHLSGETPVMHGNPVSWIVEGNVNRGFDFLILRFVVWLNGL